MPRSLTEAKETLLRKLIREGHTTRAIARQVKCGTGTVTRRKSEMGMEIRPQASQRVTTLLATRKMVDQPDLPQPSAAAQRLAMFDPIVRRAISRPIEDEDNE